MESPARRRGRKPRDVKEVASVGVDARAVIRRRSASKAQATQEEDHALRTAGGGRTGSARVARPSTASTTAPAAALDKSGASIYVYR